MGLTIFAVLCTAVFGAVLRAMVLARPDASPPVDGEIIVRPSDGRRILAALMFAAFLAGGVLMGGMALNGRPRDRATFAIIALMGPLTVGPLAADIWFRRAKVDDLGMEIRTAFGGTRLRTWQEVTSVVFTPGRGVRSVMLHFEGGDRFDVGTTTEGYAAFARIAYPHLIHTCDPNAHALLRSWGGKIR